MAKEKKGVRLEHISKIYKDPKTGKEFYAVKDTSLEIEPGTFVTLLGPSGCGKTTTLRMIAGFESPDEGEIYLGKEAINELTPNKRDTAMVFQSYALLPHYNIFDNVAYGLKLRKMPKDVIKEKVTKILKLVELEGMESRMTNQLSGGQQQRVALARALVIEPSVLLFDEPLSNLDAKLRVQMRTEIAKLHQRLGTTIIYVTHDQTEAMTLGTRIVVMKDGVVQQIDSPQNLYDNPCNLFVAGFMGSPQMNFLDATAKVAGGKAYLELDGQSIELPADKAKPVIDGNYNGKTVILGIRPEDILASPEALEKAAYKFNATCNVYELLGAEVFLYFDVVGNAVTARVEPETKIRPGKDMTFTFDTKKIHIFDKETELVIAN